MPGYFKPLRRKLGVAMLAWACVFAMGWIRSFYFGDSIEWDSIVVGSGGGRIEAAITEPLKMNWKWPVWGVEKITDADIQAEPADVFDWRFMVFGYAEIEFFGMRTRGIAIPYCAIVMPITLLSAYLLLSKMQMNVEPPIQKSRTALTQIAPIP